MKDLMINEMNIRHTCEKADGYFGHCPECEAEASLALEQTKKWQNQKFFCNGCGKEHLISEKYGGFSGWRTCSKRCHEEINIRDIANNIRKDYQPWSLRKEENEND